MSHGNTTKQTGTFERTVLRIDYKKMKTVIFFDGQLKD